MTFTYSIGSGIYDNQPEQHEAQDVETFIQDIKKASEGYDKNKTPKNSAPYVARGFRNGRRCKGDVLPAPFFFLDLDQPRKEKLPAVLKALEGFNAFCYPTASSTDDAPRMRVIMFASEAIPPGNLNAVTDGFIRDLTDKAQIAEEDLGLDPTASQAERLMFVPSRQALGQSFRFSGSLLNPGAMISLAEKSKTSAVDEDLPDYQPISENDLAAPLPPLPEGWEDPCLSRLKELRLVLGFNKRMGGWNIRCPFEEEHTAKDSESSTVYYPPDNKSSHYGAIKCLHGHCASRRQAEFFAAVGLDYEVYKNSIDAARATAGDFFANNGELHFTLRKDGVYCAKRGRDGFSRPARIFGRVAVLAKCRDSSGGCWKTLLQMEDEDGLKKEILIPREQDEQITLTTLKREGLPVYTSSKATAELLAAYRLQAPCKGRGRIVQETGWFQTEESWVYVLPGKTLVPEGAANREQIFYSSESRRTDFSKRGSLEEWRQAIGALLPYSKELTLAVGCAFAAPLLCLADDAQMNGGFHFFGKSGHGKTTAIEVAAGIYGAPQSHAGKPGRITTWTSTANAIEAAAIGHNDSLLCIDEAGAATSSIGSTIYRYSQGIEKGRSNKDGSAREQRAWRGLLLSSGEADLATFIQRSRGWADAGLETRFIDIPYTARIGDFMNGAEAPRAIATAYADLKRRAESVYGTPGEAWLRTLVDDREKAGELLKEISEQFDQQSGDVKGAQQTRAFKRFRLCASAVEMAAMLGVLPSECRGTGIRYCLDLFQSWSAARGSGDAEDRKLLEAISAEIDQPGRWTRLIAAGENESAIPMDCSSRGEISGYVQAINGRQIYFIFPSILQDRLGGTLSKRAGKSLARLDVLWAADKGRNTYKKRVDGKLTSFYAVDAEKAYALVRP